MKPLLWITAAASALLFVGCFEKNPHPPTLTSNQWHLLEMYIDTTNYVPLRDEPTITFSDSTDAVYGFGGCNNYFGTYSTSGGDNLNIQIQGRTMAMCPEITTEDALMKLLEEVTTYRFIDGQLTISDLSGKNYAIFVKRKNSVPQKE